MQHSTSHTDVLHERYFRFTLLILLFAFPVSTFLTDFLGIQSNFLSIASRAAQVLSVAAYTLFLVMHGRLKVFNFWMYVFVLFWLLYGIRLLYDLTHYGHQLGIEPKMYYLFGFVLCFLLTIPFFVPAPVDEKKLESWVYWIVLFCSVIILNNFLRSDFLFLFRVYANERLNPISAAYPSGLLLVFAFRRLLHKQEMPWIHRPLNIFAIAIALFNLAITSTKSVYIFSIILIIILIGKLATAGKRRQFIWVTAALVLTVGIMGFYLYDYFALSFSRFTEVDESSNERITYLSGAINQFLESPLWGDFIEERSLKLYPHNPVLESFMALGVVGGILFTIYFGAFMFKTISHLFSGSLLTIYILAFSVLVLNTVSGSLSFSPDMWYFTAIVAALPAATERKRVNGDQSIISGFPKTHRVQPQCKNHL